MCAQANEVSGEPIVVTTDLAKEYVNGLRAVNGISFEVRRGTVFGLLGPNGAGKSTTLGILAGRVQATSGSAWIAGINVVEVPHVAHRQMGIVPQANALDSGLTVWENLYFHLRYFGYSHRSSIQLANQSLATARLEDRRDAEIASLSGGMARRLLITRALSHDPAIVLLDEPSLGLDPHSRTIVWDALKDMRRSGRTVVIATNYLEEADALCDHVALIGDGRVVASGRPSDLKSADGTRQRVRIEVESGAERLVGLLAHHGADLGISTFGNDGDQCVEFQTRDPRQALHQVAALAEANELVITNIARGQRSLEDVFFDVLRHDSRGPSS